MDKDNAQTHAAMTDESASGVFDALQAPAIPAEDIEILKDMSEAGIHYGRKKSKTSPRMSDVIYTVRNDVAVIDVSKTLETARSASAFLSSVLEKGGTVLVVGTQPAFRDLVQSFAKKFSFPFITERWLGGTLTNFKTISLRIAHLAKLKEDKAAGRLAKFTKKEQLMIQREIDRLEKFLGGVAHMKTIPEAVLLIDVEFHLTALREAVKTGKVSVVGLANTDCSHIGDVSYAVPMNTNGRASVAWMLDYFAQQLEGKKPNVVEAPVSSNK